jgi:hypothetical protein
MRIPGHTLQPLTGGIPLEPPTPFYASNLPIPPAVAPSKPEFSSAFPAQPQVTASAATQQLQERPYPTPPPPREPRRLVPVRLRMPRSWQFWGVTSVVALMGVGALSAAILFKLPALPNCPAVFWPMASASLRLYCAQLAGEKNNVDDLLRAIALVKDLPPDHPLRPEVDRNIEEWSREILVLADDLFQKGKLKEAIQAAQRIPTHTAAAKLVDAQVKAWNETWAKAYRIYKESEAALEELDLKQAFLVATRLLSVDNTYWQTTKYQELTGVINATRKDVERFANARDLAEQGGLDNLIKALDLVGEISEKSRIHKKVKTFMADVGNQMLDLANAALERREFDEAASIARKIPEEAGLQAEVQDFNTLADAQSYAWGGSVQDLQNAINQAKKLQPSRPLYNRAQELIVTWQLEMQDVGYLSKAKTLAEGGNPDDLSAAIAEASKIPSGNPRYEEAQAEIAQWMDTVQTVQDRPILDRADQIAAAGDLDSLQAAINEASRIGSGRALTREADQRIADWTDRIQRTQDQPRLDRARDLANRGDLAGAIALAEQIASGRALSGEAQADIRQWSDRLQSEQDQPRLAQARSLADQGDISGAIAVAEQITQGRSLYGEAQDNIQSWRTQTASDQSMQQAYNLANLGTQSNLLAAIEVASQVPADSPNRSEADRMISQWSYDILQMAENRSAENPAAAVAIAETIPSYAPAFDAAQGRIQQWRQQRTPIFP